MLKHRLGTCRTRNRLAPRLQHLLELSAHVGVDLRIRVHESLVQVPAEVDSVGTADILDYGIENIQGR